MTAKGKPVPDRVLRKLGLRMICCRCGEKSLVLPMQLIEHIDEGRLLTCPRCNERDIDHVIKMVRINTHLTIVTGDSPDETSKPNDPA